jgi:hypothetical protein
MHQKLSSPRMSNLIQTCQILTKLVKCRCTRQIVITRFKSCAEELCGTPTTGNSHSCHWTCPNLHAVTCHLSIYEELHAVFNVWCLNRSMMRNVDQPLFCKQDSLVASLFLQVDVREGGMSLCFVSLRGTFVAPWDYAWKIMRYFFAC